MPGFALAPCDESFFATAPEHYVDAIEVPMSAAQVWGELTRDRTLDWCRLVSRVDWTSPRPFGVGTTRRVRVLGALAIDERYFRWEEGTRKSFYVTSVTLPLFRRFAEDYLVEEAGPTRCRLTWTVAIEPHAATRPGAPFNRLITHSLFRDTRRHFAGA